MDSFLLVQIIPPVFQLAKWFLSIFLLFPKKCENIVHNTKADAFRNIWLDHFDQNNISETITPLLQPCELCHIEVVISSLFLHQFCRASLL